MAFGNAAPDRLWSACLCADHAAHYCDAFDSGYFRASAGVGGLGHIRASRGGPPGAFPSREAEALIRGFLGERVMLEAVEEGQFNVPELGIAIMGRLLDEWRPAPAEVEALFEQAEAARQETADTMPLADFEDDWYRAGCLTRRSPGCGQPRSGRS